MQINVLGQAGHSGLNFKLFMVQTLVNADVDYLA